METSRWRNKNTTITSWQYLARQHSRGTWTNTATTRGAADLEPTLLQIRPRRTSRGLETPRLCQKQSSTRTSPRTRRHCLVCNRFSMTRRVAPHLILTLMTDKTACLGSGPTRRLSTSRQQRTSQLFGIRFRAKNEQI